MDNASTNEQPPHNVIVTSIPPPQSESIRPNPTQQPAGMAIPFIQHEYQSPAHHQPQTQQFHPGPPLPIQRSQSLGNVLSSIVQQGPLSMGDVHRTLPVSGYFPPGGQQQLPLPQSQPHPPPQNLPPRQPSSKSKFHTGPSPAAVAYQLSQEIHHYQGGATQAVRDAGPFYSHTAYQQPPAYYYDPYGQQYTMFSQDLMPYSSSYPPTPYTIPAETLPTHVGQPWYPQQPQQQQYQQQQQQQHNHHYHHRQQQYQYQQTAPYYYTQPVNYVQRPPHVQGPSQQYHGSHETFRRHSVPMRPQNASRMLDNEGAETLYSPVALRNTSSNFSNGAPPPQPSSPFLPRGPPRKPKQSGNALWVGNLPPATDIAALKDYFSNQARAEIESVFLISKSNCAFVNYRTEASCDEAMTRFHNSKFRGTRLVCRPRPRKGSTTPTPIDISRHTSSDENEGRVPSPIGANKAPPTGPAAEKNPMVRINARFRYFILKSLTVEDLEMSVKNGVWATQSHNETVLNQAFEAAESVFLIFSANKSGEYYGYARMASKITSDNSNIITWTRPPTTEQSEPDVAELPKAIYTAPTETAPKGRIIDDSARGTIFWEALSDDEIESDAGHDDEEPDEAAASGKAVSKSWGKPFKVEWLSTSRVPFYRTRGLRNNLNSGREVKVARDGTELEENAGRRLVQMFQRNIPTGQQQR